MTDEEMENFMKAFEPFPFSPNYKPRPFIPSTEWQDIPDGVIPPPLGEYRSTFESNIRQARWDNPPGPETVIDNRMKKSTVDWEASQNGDTQTETEEPEPEPQKDFDDINQYPESNSEAFYGVLGKITRSIEPETEADPIGIMIQLLIAAGCSVGHSPFFAVGATKHHTNLNACCVGRSSKSRKGSGLDFITWVMKEVDCPWVGTCMTSGLSSGEGLIYAVRDRLVKKEQVKKGGKYTGEVQEYIADFGVDDKRLFVTEAEFSRPLKAMSRESNILSEIIRSAWDHGNLRSMVKNNPYSASNAHIAIVGHITREELAKSLLEHNFFNGFSNRFLWVCVQRSKVLPFGGTLSLGEIRNEIDQLKDAITWAQDVEEMDRDDEANALWEKEYRELSADIPGKFGCTIGRGEAQVLRISMIFALLDKSLVIRAPHLRAAVALWQYCVDSARHLFLKSFDDPHAAKIFSALCQHPDGMTKTELSVNVFKRNLSKTKMDEALSYLRRLKLVHSSAGQINGRSIEHWFGNTQKPEKAEYD